MNRNLSLQSITPMYIDRRTRGTFPKQPKDQSKKVGQQSSQKVINKDSKSINIVLPDNLNRAQIQWHIRDTFIMKKQLKQMLAKYFLQRYDEIEVMRQKNVRQADYHAAIMREMLMSLLNQKQKIYKILQHICQKHAKKTCKKSDNIQQQQKLGQNECMQNENTVKFDCNDCLSIFTKIFLKLAPQDQSKQQQSHQKSEDSSKLNLTEQKHSEQEAYKPRLKKYKTSILLSDLHNQSLQNHSNQKIESIIRNQKKREETVTILDSLLDTQIYKMYTKNKIATFKSIRQNQYKINQEQQLKKIQQNKQNRQKQKQLNQKISEKRRKALNCGRTSASNRFYEIIREAIRTNGINLQGDIQQSKSSDKQSDQSSQQVGNNLKKNQSKQKEQYQYQATNQSQAKVIKINFQSKNKSIRTPNKLKSNQSSPKRLNSKIPSYITSKTNRNPRQQSGTKKSTYLSQPHHRQKNKNKSYLRNHQKSKVKKRQKPEKKSTQTTAKESIINTQTHEIVRKNNNKNTYGNRTYLARFPRYDKAMSGAERMTSLRKNKKRQGFLGKKKKTKELGLKSAESDDQAVNNITNNNSIKEVSEEEDDKEVLKLEPKLTKYEAARMMFNMKYSELAILKNSKNSQMTKKLPDRKKRPSINLLVPPQNTNQSKISSFRRSSANFSDLFDDLNQDLQTESYLNGAYPQGQKKSENLLSRLDFTKNNKQFDLKEVKNQIKFYLKKHKTESKGFQMLKFFTYMEQSLKKSLQQKLRHNTATSLALESDIQNVEIQNFLSQIDPHPEFQYQGSTRLENQLSSQNQIMPQKYQQRFITKLNNHVIDLISWNHQQFEIRNTAMNNRLNQVSLKDIEQIPI